MEARRFWPLLVAVALVAAPSARGIWLNVPTSGQKCISEELDYNVVVMATYFSFYGDRDDSNSSLSPTLSVEVLSPLGKELHREVNVSYGRFAFTTTEAGEYEACFSVFTRHQNSKIVTVGLDWKIGIAAKDWDSIAKKENIEGLDLELKKLEDSVEAIHKNMNRLIIRDIKMRRVITKTNGRVAGYSILSLGVCIVVSILQLLYLRRYFRKKKLV